MRVMHACLATMLVTTLCLVAGCRKPEAAEGKAADVAPPTSAPTNLIAEVPAKEEPTQEEPTGDDAAAEEKTADEELSSGEEEAAEAAATPAQGAGDWKKYEGAWFTINYPAGWKVVPREKSTTSTEGYDGVSFISPDGAVEFYVHSPQWEGAPGWVDMVPGEEIVDSRSEGPDSRQTYIVTLRGPGGRYMRRYEDTMDTTQNTRLVFGIKYKTEAAYKAHKEQYAKFKQSLEQFAD